jgi:hypothetical protein
MNYTRDMIYYLSIYLSIYSVSVGTSYSTTRFLSFCAGVFSFCRHYCVRLRFFPFTI